MCIRDRTTTVLLETMSGKGSEIGKTFEELAAIIERVELKEKLGVCLDTCHVCLLYTSQQACRLFTEMQGSRQKSAAPVSRPQLGKSFQPDSGRYPVQIDHRSRSNRPGPQGGFRE